MSLRAAGQAVGVLARAVVVDDVDNQPFLRLLMLCFVTVAIAWKVQDLLLDALSFLCESHAVAPALGWVDKDLNQAQRFLLVFGVIAQGVHASGR